MLNCWRLLANIANFWSNKVATSKETGSFGFDDDDDVGELLLLLLPMWLLDVVVDVVDVDGGPAVKIAVVDDDELGWDNVGGGVWGCSLAVMIDVWGGSVVGADGTDWVVTFIDEPFDGDDDDEATADPFPPFVDWECDEFVLLRFRGWYW